MAAIKHVNNNRDGDVAILLRYEPIYRYTIPHRTATLGHLALPPLQIGELVNLAQRAGPLSSYNHMISNWINISVVASDQKKEEHEASSSSCNSIQLSGGKTKEDKEEENQQLGEEDKEKQGIIWSLLILLSS